MGSSTNQIYTIYGTPTGSLTKKRLSWCTLEANGKGAPDGIAGEIHDPLVTKFAYTYLENAWKVLDGTKADCDTLSRCMLAAVKLLGVGGSVDNVYASTDAECLDPQTRPCPGGVHGSEALAVIQGGVYNRYETCCIVNDKWYPGGIAGHKDSALEILRLWLSKTGVYQVWIYHDPPLWRECFDPGPNPVPAP